MPQDTESNYAITTESALRDLLGQASGLAAKKCLSELDGHCRDFIALSPFLCLGTMSADGRADISPRGDPAGFVQVLDNRTIAIPDRPGNKRLDTMSNILSNPSVGVLFMIPGFEDTLRINGSATLTCDPKILNASPVNGRVPKIAIRIAVAEAFLHCAKALKRARLWDPASRVNRKRLPSLAHMILEQINGEGEVDDRTIKNTQDGIEEEYKSHLY